MTPARPADENGDSAVGSEKGERRMWLFVVVLAFLTALVLLQARRSGGH